MRRVLEQVDQAARQCADVVNGLPSNVAMFECIRRLSVNTVGRIDFASVEIRTEWLTELRDKVLADLEMADLTFGPSAGSA